MSTNVASILAALTGTSSLASRGSCVDIVRAHAISASRTEPTDSSVDIGSGDGRCSILTMGRISELPVRPTNSAAALAWGLSSSSIVRRYMTTIGNSKVRTGAARDCRTPKY